ncbi:hypothetical protein VPNG_05024 [Cytospora leucostoma]|uniref:Uncharacterized protein n=1 Tax=Cytospora leucostoma TaxID=1230097 RepID=A0A423X780_9PEZI|nr:hypothetical protein VPNG_05024 [Cytospora leucostoma]
MAEFELLPIEIMNIVLKDLDSPEDLASTIRSSPCALAALQDDRCNILAQVIINNLSLYMLKEVICIRYCPTFEFSDNYDSWNVYSPFWVLSYGSWAQKVADFEDEYSNIHPYHYNVVGCFPYDLPSVLTVYRMRAAVNSLIADYVAHVNAMSTPDGPGPTFHPPDKSNLASLTRQESDRLLAAFFRYEIMCRFTGRPYLQQFASQDAESMLRHWETSFEYHKAWAMEEICHVHDYVCSRYHMAFREIDHDITTWIEHNKEIIAQSSHLPPHLRPITSVARQLVEDGGPRYLFSRALYEHGQPQGTAGRLDMYVYIMNLARLGLGVLRHFLTLDRLGRRQFILETFEVLPSQSPYDELWEPVEAIEPSANFLQDERRRRLQKRAIQTAGYDKWRSARFSGGSIAWDAQLGRLGRDGIPILLDPHAVDSQALRKLGWAFWELERLKQLGIVTEQSTESNIVFRTDLQVQPIEFGRDPLPPDLSVLDQELVVELWEKDFKPQFGTMPCPPKEFEERYQQIEPILQYTI